jgi:hypothetical protein
MPSDLPVAETAFAGGSVLVMLGTDLATNGVPAGATTGAATPAAGVTTDTSPNAATDTSAG